MNSHLNIFNTYSKESRQYQLENDLTRALAICLQENTLFFNQVLHAILPNEALKALFSTLEAKNEITISIQKRSSEITNFEKLYAVSLSEYEMSIESFKAQKFQKKFDPICDIVLIINGIVIIIEAKRDNLDCTAQLYNQAFNICKNIGDVEMENLVTPVDLNWTKLMEIAVKVYSFEIACGSSNRFLNDFIHLVRAHNFKWLPEPPIFALSAENTKEIERRIESAINELHDSKKLLKLNYRDRLGLLFDRPWAQEVLFRVSEKGELHINIYPGNTKAQGDHIFNNDPKPKKFIYLDKKEYQISKLYHIRFSGQGYISGLWFTQEDLQEELYTKTNFIEYCGRKSRDDHWKAIEILFNKSFKTSYDWKGHCGWETKFIQSNRTRFDMSFGYDLSVVIPFQELRGRDQNKSDLTGLTNLISAVVSEFRTIYS